MNKFFKLILWIAMLQATAYAIGMLTNNSINTWYVSLQRSTLTPPSYVFSIVWAILYVIMS